MATKKKSKRPAVRTSSTVPVTSMLRRARTHLSGGQVHAAYDLAWPLFEGRGALTATTRVALLDVLVEVLVGVLAQELSLDPAWQLAAVSDALEKETKKDATRLARCARAHATIAQVAKLEGQDPDGIVHRRHATKARALARRALAIAPSHRVARGVLEAFGGTRARNERERRASRR